MNEKEFYNGLFPRAAENNPAMRAAEAPVPNKLTDGEYFAEKTSLRAAEDNPAMRVANPDEVIHRIR